MGRIKKHSTRDAINTTITVNGMSAIKLPKRPPINVSPQKAMIVVIVAENTGGAMRRAAFIDAVTGSSPMVRARKSACSPTTMASSTTIPRVIINPNSDTIFSVKPKAYIKATAANIATGIPAATQNAVRADRNKNSKPITKTNPNMPFSTKMPKRS